MKISVITIVFNDREHIEKTIESITSQTARNHIEYIVVDGASTDGTSELIRQRIGDINKYICEPDTGIYNAMNKGLKVATGDYVIFINSGDKFSSKDTIEKIIEYLNNDIPDVIYGHYREVSENKQNSKIIPCRNSDKIWYGPVASHQSTMYRLEHLRNNGLKYDETYKIAADYKLTAQAIKSAKSLKKINVCISDFDISGISSTNQDLGLEEANRVRREVFKWGKFRIALLTIVILSARYFKRFAYPLYTIIRNHA